MRKRLLIRPVTGMVMITGLITFTLTEGFTTTPEKLVLFDAKSLFFVILFTLIYSFMVDTTRTINMESIGLGALYGGIFGFLIGVMLMLDLPLREQSSAWKYAVLPLFYGLLAKVFADSIKSGSEPDKQLNLF